MVSKTKLAKATGWLIIIGPLVGIVRVLIKLGNFISEHPDGASQVAFIRKSDSLAAA